MIYLCRLAFSATWASLLLSTALTAGTVTIQSGRVNTTTTVREVVGTETTFGGVGDKSVLSVSALQEALRWGDVTVIATPRGRSQGDIVVDADITWHGPFILTLSAHRNVVVKPGVRIGNIGTGGLALRADNRGSGSGVVTLAGKVDFSGSAGHVSIRTNGPSGAEHPHQSPYVAAVRTNGTDGHQVVVERARANVRAISCPERHMESIKATGVSADGTTVVGRCVNKFFTEKSFRWVNGNLSVLTPLPCGSAICNSAAAAVNSVGTVVVGGTDSTTNSTCNGVEAYRWSIGGMTGLGCPKPGDKLGFNLVYGVNGAGNVIVGSGWFVKRPQQGVAIRWTGRPRSLGYLPGGSQSEAFGVSRDGAVVVGYSNNAAQTLEAFRWEPGAGMNPLGILSGASIAHGVSGNGYVVVGRSGGAAFRWVWPSGPMTGIFGGGSGCTGVAYAASRDGSVVVGGCGSGMYWSEITGPRPIEELLMSQGVDVTGWEIGDAMGVSADGTVVAGWARHNGKWRGYVAHLPRAPKL